MQAPSAQWPSQKKHRGYQIIAVRGDSPLSSAPVYTRLQIGRMRTDTENPRRCHGRMARMLKIRRIGTCSFVPQKTTRVKCPCFKFMEMSPLPVRNGHAMQCSMFWPIPRGHGMHMRMHRMSMQVGRYMHMRQAHSSCAAPPPWRPAVAASCLTPRMRPAHSSQHAASPFTKRPLQHRHG